MTYTNHNFIAQRLGATADEYVSSFLTTRISRKEVDRGVVDQLKVQMMWLEAPSKVPKVTTNHEKRPRKRLSSRQKKGLKLYQIPKDHQKYDFSTSVSASVYVSVLFSV